MSDDWKPGDLALCVRGGFLSPRDTRSSVTPPVSGRIYRVEYTLIEPSWQALGLGLEDGPLNVDGTREWLAARFVKITPEEADEFDRETIALLTGRPAKVPA